MGFVEKRTNGNWEKKFFYDHPVGEKL